MNSHDALLAPSSEATSLILHAHHACSYGKCSYCPNLQDIGRERFNLREFREFLAEESQRYLIEEIDSIFLAEGNTLSLEVRQVLDILRALRQAFPFVRSISAYGNARSILHRTPRELAVMHREGLTRVHMGFESGNDDVLRLLNKGINAAEMEKAARSVKDAGFELFLYVLIAAGGSDLSGMHISDTIELIDRIQPAELECNTLVVVPHTQMDDLRQQGRFHPLTAHAAIDEVRSLVANIQSPLTFQCNHISNYCNVAGALPQDRARMLQEIDYCLTVDEEAYGKRGIVSIPIPA